MTYQSWSTWRCPGLKADGSTCGRIVAEVDLESGSRVRIRCHNCKTTTLCEAQGDRILISVVAIAHTSIAGMAR